MRYRYTGPGGDIFPDLTSVIAGGEPEPGEEFDFAETLTHPHIEAVGDGSVPQPHVEDEATPDPALEAPEPTPGREEE